MEGTAEKQGRTQWLRQRYERAGKLGTNPMEWACAWFLNPTAIRLRRTNRDISSVVDRTASRTVAQPSHAAVSVCTGQQDSVAVTRYGTARRGAPKRIDEGRGVLHKNIDEAGLLGRWSNELAPMRGHDPDMT